MENHRHSIDHFNLIENLKHFLFLSLTLKFFQNLQIIPATASRRHRGVSPTHAFTHSFSIFFISTFIVDLYSDLVRAVILLSKKLRDSSLSFVVNSTYSIVNHENYNNKSFIKIENSRFRL